LFQDFSRTLDPSCNACGLALDPSGNGTVFIANRFAIVLRGQLEGPLDRLGCKRRQI
jgi:hypothetical protein